LNDKSEWKQHDAVELLNTKGPFNFPIKIDYGLNDEFLNSQLLPYTLDTAIKNKKQNAIINFIEDFDHS